MMVACPDFAAALDQLQRPQPSQRVVQTPAVRFVAGFGRHFLFVECIGIYLGQRLLLLAMTLV